MIHKAEHPGESSMHFFPMIDLEPGDMSCVYSTLIFVCKEAEKYSKCPIITFDQPLYWKALLIIRHEMEDSTLSKIVLRLGGFHLQMSFLGSTGFLMSGSGLEELLGTTYAPNAVKHMLSGKAVSRAVRGHFLVESALNSMLVRKVFVQEDGISDTTESPVSDAEVCSLGTIHNDLKTAFKIYEDLITGKANLDCVIDDNVFERIHTAMSKYEIEVSECKTARMWFTYLRMVSLLHSFIRAERMGDWHLHLDTVQRMLPYFAASGHNLYLKSAYVYLTDMQQLPITHPETYHDFVSGKHVIRRSDRFWAGIWTDLTIEQVLMRSLKSTGGLTRGRGMTDFQRAVWILSSPVCAEMSMAMQELTHIQYTSSDQHKEASTSRQARDEKDLTTTFNFLIDPFNSDMKELRNIDNGVTAEENVNVADCLEIGNTIIESMKGSDAMSYVFRRKNKDVTLAASNSFRVDDESISVDPQLMFQRLSSIARDTSSDLSDVFKYELSGVPSALFDNSGLLREAQKSQLADAIWSFGDCGVDSIDSCSSFVIDGGSLLHRLTWPQNVTYGSIITMYTHYISSRYKNPCIIFDGYSETPSTKDVAHLRRSKGMLWRKVIFNDSTVCSMKKEAFLTNKDNKKRFIDLLTIHLRDSDCEVLQAQGDADYMLAMKTIEKAASGNVALIGEDTDLLILLLHHLTQNLAHDIYFYSDKQTKNDLKIWDLRKTRSALGVDVCSCLAFLHALTGCDTTSRIYGIGKHQALKKTVSHISMVKKAAELFGREDAARTE
ncbi:hypothetical protein FSP39_024991 [Pinctada imbricata]|uniref:Uncharacterized protein n=1 Tax=Pinctada imbricata TaxID=66713 RepID=A0AA88YIC9_PINIB|nr:hypothetical protein FSP39_024991 [Pinctada imbricata]